MIGREDVFGSKRQINESEKWPIWLNPFITEFLKWIRPSLNLIRTIVQNQNLSQKWKQNDKQCKSWDGKHFFWHMLTVKAQIRLRICAVWSGPSLYANRIIGYGYYRMFQWGANAGYRLCACAKRSESAHFAEVRRYFFRWMGTIYTVIKYRKTFYKHHMPLHTAVVKLNVFCR